MQPFINFQFFNLFHITELQQPLISTLQIITIYLLISGLIINKMKWKITLAILFWLIFTSVLFFSRQFFYSEFNWMFGLILIAVLVKKTLVSYSGLNLYLLAVIFGKFLFFLATNFQIEESFVFEITILLLLICVVIYFKKLNLFKKLIYAIENHPIYKSILLFAIIGLLLVIVLTQNNYHFISRFIFIGLVLANVFHLLFWINSLHQLLNKQFQKNHDLHKSIRGVTLAVHSDKNKFSSEIADLNTLIGVTTEDFEMGKINENIKKLIDYKRVNSSQKNLEINSIIHYYEHHSSVSLTVLCVMIEILLDNAIELKPKFPLEITLSVDEESLDLIVKNPASVKEYEFLKKALNQKKKISSKGKNRGFGLLNLKIYLQKYGLKYVVAHKLHPIYLTDYVYFVIKFDNIL